MDTEKRYYLAKERANSRSLDLTKCSDSPEVESVVDHLYAVMESAQLTQKQRTYQIQLRDHLKVILLDLYVVYRSDPSRYLAYSRDPKAYNKSSSRYHSVTNRYGFRNIVKVVDFLINLDLIENVEGYEDLNVPGKSYLSRMRAKGELIKLMREDFGVLLPMISNDAGDETIILKAPKPERNWKLGRSAPKPKAEIIDYDDTPATIQMRDNLNRINKHIEQSNILLNISDEELVKLHQRIRDERNSTFNDDNKRELIDFSRKRLRRIFNNSSFEQGGRFYGGWWQNLPKKYREFIRINYKNVVEYDYKGLHINMLYAQKGLPLPKGDPYRLEGYSEAIRPFLKVLLLILINAETEKKAIMAIEKSDNPNDRVPDEVENLEALIKDFRKKHSLIEESYGSNAGIHLQYLDSKIAERVMLAFADRKHPILPMHDSFIVHHNFRGFLQKQMNKAFYDEFGVECEVELNNDSIATRQERQGGARELDDVPLKQLLRTGTHDVYEGLWSEHVKWEDMEHKRRLQSLRDQGHNRLPGTDIMIDDILNDNEPEEPLPF